jgi:hypothetical protein
MMSTYHFWVDPPTRQLPIVGEEVRFAVGTPRGMSSNSWKLWTRGNDVYFACRDNFQEFKLSLHASGIWRLAFTKEALTKLRALRGYDENRVINRWQPDLSAGATVAFELVLLPASLYLAPPQRERWPRDVVFAELMDPTRVTAIALTIANGQQPLSFTADQPGAVLGLVPIPDGRSAQLVLTGYDPGPFLAAIVPALEEIMSRMDAVSALPDGVTALFGAREQANPWFATMPNRVIIEEARRRGAPSDPR